MTYDEAFLTAEVNNTTFRVTTYVAKHLPTGEYMPLQHLPCPHTNIILIGEIRRRCPR